MKLKRKDNYYLACTKKANAGMQKIKKFLWA
jgi:hypothetical protein